MLLYDWPIGVNVNRFTPKSGPVVYGASQSMTDFVQTVAAPTGLVSFELGIAPCKGEAARHLRALVIGLAAGANAVRWTHPDPDRMSYRDMGLTLTNSQEANGVPWDNGLPWDNGRNWTVGWPSATLSSSVALGDGIVAIDTTNWGGELDIGTIFGISGQFGIYTVSAVQFAGSIATARIWPTIRRPAAAGSLVTLRPTIAGRLVSPDAGQWSRREYVDGATVTLVEVPDQVIRRYATAL
ncbi:hypothetical protein [Prosthecomicrobium hirschii]|uniref:hypothetical protein n=1 Tax=Prosthecodimorpha hirschii TaxID=665126 RepID=UPI00221EFBE2|nr:hypothetical protein [Prosthecomicrobium hirschii]MCW1844120.1 hypothetical protein [Prosthecomicrobium hirschii]